MSFGDKNTLDMQGNKTPVNVTMTAAEANSLQTLVFAATQVQVDRHMAIAIVKSGGDGPQFVVDVYSAWQKLTSALLKACGEKGAEADRELALLNGRLAALLDQEREAA